MSLARIRRTIKTYIQFNKNIDLAVVKCVREKNEYVTAFKCKIPVVHIRAKVNIINRLNDYYNKRASYNLAVYYTTAYLKTLEEAAEYVNLSPKSIQKEINQHMNLKNNHEKPYEYDKPLTDDRIFTFNEELSLLRDLKQWKDMSPLPCSCFICAMMKLLSLAYQLAKKKNKSYPAIKNEDQPADEEFLIQFEMTHSCSLKKLYPRYDVYIEEIYKTCKYEEQSSSSIDDKNICKVDTSTKVLNKRKFNKISQETTATVLQNKTSEIVNVLPSTSM